MTGEWDDHRVRDTRLIYVENDPALRAIFARGLARVDGIELVLETGSPSLALESPALGTADAALLDLALGPGEMNGIDLGLAMREQNPDIGIIVYSQFSLLNLSRRVPARQSMGWTFIPKSGDMEMAELASIIRMTARGVSQDLAGADGAPDSGVLDSLSPRQRAVMALAASGLTAPEIAKRLGATHDLVRKDLSRAYRLLVPESDGGDLRTKAVLAYLALMREEPWEE